MADNQRPYRPNEPYGRAAAPGPAPAHGGGDPLAELARLVLRAVGGELEPARVDAERLEEADPELVRRPEVEHAGDADAERRARLSRRLKVRPWRGERRFREPLQQCWGGHP